MRASTPPLRAFCALDTVKKIESGRRRPSRQLADQLADVLGLEATARTQFLALARPAEADPDETGADDPGERAVALAATHRPLPRQVTPFIGRARELGALLDALVQPDTRLVTIVAPGGMGKTRLALTAAERVRDAATFPSGVALASLAPVAEAAGLDRPSPMRWACRSIPRARAARAPSCLTTCARRRCYWCSTTASTCSKAWRSWPVAYAPRPPL